MPFALPPFTITDVVTRVAVVEGYNTNTYQAQDDPNVPVIRRHPSPYTGIDGQVQLRMINGYGDIHDLRIGGRVQHYTPLESQPGQSDDASLNAAWSSRFTLSPRGFISVGATASLSTLNGTHLSDGTLFQFDPTVVRRTFWISDMDVSYTYDLAPTWRVRAAVGLLLSGTINQPPTPIPGQASINHRGLDFVQPYVEGQILKDFTPRATGDLDLNYRYSYNLYVLDLTQIPPKNIGPNKLAFLTGTAGYTYRFTQELVNSIRAGVTLASPPPEDADQRPVLAPFGSEELSYTREFWQFVLVGSYSYSSLNPRIGAGPSANGNALLVGTPWRRGHWRDFSVLANIQGGYSELRTGQNASTGLKQISGGAEMRYGVNNWLGIMAGYQGRYATFTGEQFVPPFLQHLIFVGLSGYFTTDKTFPTLTTFSAPNIPL